MDHVAGLVPLVSAYRHRRLQIFKTSQAHGVEGSPHGGERCRQQPGDASEGEVLMTQVHGLLQLLWIERPPLSTTPAASIHEGSAGARAIASQALVGGSQADPSLRCQISRGSAS